MINVKTAFERNYIVNSVDGPQSVYDMVVMT